jgi:hypothetical protein
MRGAGTVESLALDVVSGATGAAADDALEAGATANSSVRGPLDP